MNLLRSVRAFREAWAEDAAFRALGRPLGWSVYFHYLGRWHDRRGLPMKVRSVAFSHRGRRMDLQITDKYMGAFKGVFLDREYDCAEKFSTPPQRIVDLGGNIGFGSVFLSRLFPGAHFAVVEPDPRNLELLEKNLALNAVQARIFAGAIGPEAGELALRFGDNPTCSSLAGTGMHDLAGTVQVKLNTVPEVLAAMHWDRIDLLKIDIEGAEESLLTQNNAWLGKVKSILIEVHPNTTAEHLNRHLGPYGFQLARFRAGREPVYFAQRVEN
jgi:FkbM family methyltransferase